ncbi:hypothetical protein HDA35_005828 [Micromonospora purpureochromogenes]|uniref:Uncharacterized protein n=1 Tax=Micromonospora purpureochromogenes TaxID=47872 RepID=A0ABX2RXF2_9ACTN|nr:hypothetical protein [Micromonospora purpureochromogenes]
MTSRFRFISTHRAAYGVKRPCRVLAVSRSGFRRPRWVELIASVRTSLDIRKSG